MSLTETEVEICNQALGKFGSESMDYDVQTTNVALKCIQHYEQTRDALQRRYRWNFLSKRIVLVGDWETGKKYTTDHYAWEDEILYKCNTAHTSTTFNSNYVYDGDDIVYDGDDLDVDDLVVDSDVTFNWTMVLEVDYTPDFYWNYKYQLPADFLRLKPEYLHGYYGVHFKIEGDYILCDETEINLHYIAKVTDPDDFDQLFTEVLILELALKLLYPIAGTNTQDIKLELQRERMEAIKGAMAVCESETNQTGHSDWNEARSGSGIL